jgi:hypothetical protein
MGAYREAPPPAPTCTVCAMVKDVAAGKASADLAIAVAYVTGRMHMAFTVICPTHEELITRNGAELLARIRAAGVEVVEG